MVRIKVIFGAFICLLVVLCDLLPDTTDAANISSAVSGPQRRPGGDINLARIEMLFVENQGQVKDRGIRYYAQTFSGLHAVTEKGEIVYAMPAVTLRERLLGGRDTSPVALEKSTTVVNIFKGNDKGQWKSGIPAYGAISLGEPYRHVELHVRVAGNRVEKVFHVKPGGDPKDIRLRIDGARSARVTAAGELEISASRGMAAFTKPVAYQEIHGRRIAVEAGYSLDAPGEGIQARPEAASDVPLPSSETGITYSFVLAAYDRDHTLVIDPMLTATYFGGSGTEYPSFVASGPDNSVYLAGLTFSADFPFTENAFQAYPAGQGDVFIARFDSALGQLEAATYLGGEAAESMNGMKISAAGDIYVTGSTYSKDFPYTEGAYDTTFPTAEYDETVFVSRLDGSLSKLLSSTFLGGQGQTFSSGIDVDAEGRVYVAGYGPCGFPVTEGAYMTGCPPGTSSPGFIALLDGSLSSLVASTHYDHPIYGLALGSLDDVYVAARRAIPSSQTASEAVVARLDGSLSALLGDTTGHGPYPGEPGAMAMDGQGNVFVAGRAGPGYPVTSAAGAASLIGKYCHIFVAKFSYALTNLVATTCIGSDMADPRVDSFQGLALNSSGEPYIVGYTARQFPTTPGSYQPICSSYKAFITRLDSALTGMVASTCLGGTGQDFGYAIAVDPSDGGVYVAGRTSSADFPVTAEAYDRVWDGMGKPFVAKLDGALSPDPLVLTVIPAGTGAGEIKSDPPGILCGSDCTESLPTGTVVMLTAAPLEGSVFTGWSEPACGSAATCQVTMTADKTVTATFEVCSYGLKPSAKDVPFRGATVPVTVTRTGSAACGKPSVGSVEGWVRGVVQSWNAKTGRGVVKVTIDKNPSSADRSGELLIGGTPFAVTQAATPCVMKALSPANKAVPRDVVAEEHFLVTVDPQDCQWYTAIADTDAKWIAVAPEAGTGNGSVAYAVGSNDTGKLRTGRITVVLSQDLRKKKVFTVRQAK